MSSDTLILPSHKPNELSDINFNAKNTSKNEKFKLNQIILKNYVVSVKKNAHFWDG